MKNIRHWFIQKPKEHNRPHNDNVAVFQEFKPTVGYDGFEWIKVISLDDFHKEVGINITKYIQLQSDLALAREEQSFQRRKFNKTYQESIKLKEGYIKLRTYVRSHCPTDIFVDLSQSSNYKECNEILAQLDKKGW